MAEHIERVELPDGDWADITTRPSHRRVNRLYRAWQQGAASPEQYLDVMAEVILALTIGWSVRGDDGHELPLTAEGLADAPFATTKTLFDRISATSKAILGAADPNA